MRKEKETVFNDPETRDPNYWPSIRMSDVVEVGRRLRRSGMRDVVVAPEHLTVLFTDPLIRANVSLEISPWYDSRKGWYWYANIDLPNGFISGPLGEGRWVLQSPWPRRVVRAYLRETWYERRPLARKARRR